MKLRFRAARDIADIEPPGASGRHSQPKLSRAPELSPRLRILMRRAFQQKCAAVLPDTKETTPKKTAGVGKSAVFLALTSIAGYAVPLESLHRVTPTRRSNRSSAQAARRPTSRWSFQDWSGCWRLAMAAPVDRLLVAGHGSRPLLGTSLAGNAVHQLMGRSRADCRRRLTSAKLRCTFVPPLRQCGLK